MKEDFVTESIVKWLRNNGYKVSKISLGRQKGPDIKAYHNNGCTYTVEAKGETKNPNVDVEQVLGQLLFRMSAKLKSTNYYAIGIPNKKKYLNIIKKLHKFLVKHLGIKVLIVDEYGVVKEFKDFKQK